MNINNNELQQLPPYEPTDYLKTPQSLAAFLEDLAAETDPAILRHAMGIAVNALQSMPCAQATPVAWVTFGTKDGKKKLDIGSPTTNPDYVKAHKEWLWEPLVRADQSVNVRKSSPSYEANGSAA